MQTFTFSATEDNMESKVTGVWVGGSHQEQAFSWEVVELDSCVTVLVVNS